MHAQFFKAINGSLGIHICRNEIVPTDVVRFSFERLGKILADQQMRTGPEQREESSVILDESLEHKVRPQIGNDMPQSMAFCHMGHLVREDTSQLLWFFH